MTLPSTEQRRLHLACLRRHWHGVVFELRGLARACGIDPLTAAALIIACLTISALVFFAGCSKAPQKQIQTTTLTPQQIRGYIQGVVLDDSYAAPTHAWLVATLASYKADLAAQGIRWDATFDCNRFTVDFIAYANRQFYLQSWYSPKPAQAVAVGMICYDPTPTTAHAICFAVDDRGLEFFDPQNGAFVTLTAAQRSSIFFPLI